ncbi:MAG: hypothetical protein MJ211_06745, partial [Bacteroidales bacterium]|nr:hypothetical protein [Bacteroidales bacterium]
ALLEYEEKGRVEGREEGREEGRVEGEKIGIEKGKFEEKIANIKIVMNKLSMDFNTACEFLNIPKDKIEEIRKMI